MGFKVPKQSLIYLLTCGTVILLFIILGIAPSQKKIRELNQQIAATRARAEEQKTLASIYQTLKQRAAVQHAQGRSARLLPLPDKKEQAGVEISKLTDTVKDISRMANLEMVSLSPGLDSLDGSSKMLVVEAVIRGEFLSFRRFLIGLGGLRYVGHIEDLQLRQNTDGTEMRIRFWVERA